MQITFWPEEICSGSASLHSLLLKASMTNRIWICKSNTTNVLKTSQWKPQLYLDFGGIRAAFLLWELITRGEKSEKLQPLLRILLLFSVYFNSSSSYEWIKRNLIGVSLVRKKVNVSGCSHLGFIQPSINLPEVFSEEILTDGLAVDSDPLSDLDQVWRAGAETEQENYPIRRFYSHFKKNLTTPDDRY